MSPEYERKYIEDDEVELDAMSATHDKSSWPSTTRKIFWYKNPRCCCGSNKVTMPKNSQP